MISSKRMTLALLMALVAATLLPANAWYEWPMPNGNRNSSGTLGPRNVWPTWFHHGFDIALHDNFYAPNDMTIEHIYRSGCSSFMDCSFDYGALDVIRFYHIDIPSYMNVGDWFQSGALVCHTNSACSADHLHFEVWDWEYDYSWSGYWSYSFHESRRRTVHPLYEFSRFNYDDYLNWEYDYSPKPTNPWPMENNKYYIEVEIRQPKGCLALNEIMVNVEGPNGEGTSQILEGANWIDFEDGFNVDKTDHSQPFIYNGVKIIPAAFNSPYNTKTITFRFYIAQGAPLPTTLSFTARTAEGTTKAWANNLQLAVCVECDPPPGAPLPPTTVTASTISDGVRITWDDSPTLPGDAERAYLVYRRRASGTEPIDARPIAVVKDRVIGQNQSYDDLISDPRTCPGESYKYSIATISPDGEGYNSHEVTKSVPFGSSGAYHQPFTYSIGAQGYEDLVGFWDYESASGWAVPAGINVYGYFMDSWQEANATYGYADSRGPLLASTVDRTNYNVTVAANVQWYSGLTPQNLYADNRLWIDLYDDSGSPMYSIWYKPTGTNDTYSDPNLPVFGIAKQFGTVHQVGIPNAEPTPGQKVNIRLVLNKLISAGGDSRITAYANLQDGEGQRELFSLVDEAFSRVARCGFYLETGYPGSAQHCDTRVDDVRVLVDE